MHNLFTEYIKHAYLMSICLLFTWIFCEFCLYWAFCAWC